MYFIRLIRKLLYRGYLRNFLALFPMNQTLHLPIDYRNYFCSAAISVTQGSTWPLNLNFGGAQLSQFAPLEEMLPLMIVLLIVLCRVIAKKTSRHAYPYLAQDQLTSKSLWSRLIFYLVNSKLAAIA